MQQVARTSQKQSSEKLSTSWTAKPWQLWKLLHTSSNESTCVQLHASDIKLLTNENSWHQIQKQWNEHHMNWNHKTWRIQNCCNCQTPTKPMHSFCKIVGRLLQTELDPLTTVPYTASASSSVLTASVVPRTASALKTWTTSWRNASKWKPTVASKFTRLAMTFKWVAMKFNWLAMKLERSAHPSFGLSWSALHSGQKVNLEITMIYSPLLPLSRGRCCHKRYHSRCLWM